MMTEHVVTVRDEAGNEIRRGPPKTEGVSRTTEIFEGITMNLPYFQTIPGMIKLIQMVIGSIYNI